MGASGAQSNLKESNNKKKILLFSHGNLILENFTLSNNNF